MFSLKSFYDYLEKISDRGVKPGLQRIHKAVQLLGNPEKSYKIIHIAGTNGKGTSCYGLSQLLTRSGYKVGLNLSPHVDSYRERFQISWSTDQQMHLISDEDLLKTHQFLVTNIPESLGLTYFEWAVLLALQYFADQKADVVVLETGLGGRWDATNVIEESLVSGITSIGLDHMNYLGDTLDKILNEKLQIIKKNSDFLFGVDDEALVSQAKTHCLSLNTAFHQVSKTIETTFENYLSRVKNNQNELQNLSFVLAMGLLLKQKGFDINFESFLSDGFKSLPGRYETISKSPLIIRDGAHNEAGLKALKEFLCQNHDDYVLIFGCLKDRNFLELASIIRSNTKNYWARFEAGPRTTDVSVYQSVSKKMGGEIVTLDNHFKNKLLEHEKNKTIVVCGSFYLCSAFKEMWLKK